MRLTTRRPRLQRRLCDVDALPVAALDALANLRGGSAQLGFLVGVGRLAEAGGACGAVRALEAAVEAVVSERAVAVAVTGLLEKHAGDARRHFVDGDLVGVGEIGAGQLRSAEYGGQGVPGCGGIVGGDVFRRIGPLCGGSKGQRTESQTAEQLLHPLILADGRGSAWTSRSGPKKGGTNGNLSVPGGQ